MHAQVAEGVEKGERFEEKSFKRLMGWAVECGLVQLYEVRFSSPRTPPLVVRHCPRASGPPSASVATVNRIQRHKLYPVTCSKADATLVPSTAAPGGGHNGGKGLQARSSSCARRGNKTMKVTYSRC